MPPSSPRSPRFQRPHRQRSRSYSPRRHLTDPLDAIRASRHSPRRDTLGPNLGTAIGTPQRISADPPNCAGRSSAEDEGWLGNPTDGSMHVSDSTAPTRAVKPDSSEILGLHSSAARLPTDFATDIIPFAQPRPSQVSSSSIPSQQSLDSEPLGQPLGLYSHIQNPGMFNQAHNFTVTGTFIENNITSCNVASNQIMKDLLNETIPGAAFDSSARYPPPRCHPGTRLAILKRCLEFIASCEGMKKVRWVVGAAGVGKSAIMQNVAESPDLPVTAHASVFLSVLGRNDGAKAVMTIAYQFAAKLEVYRHLIQDEITRDPSLLQSSMPVQFRKLIVEPFVHHSQLNANRILIIIDGLDECNVPRTQQELIRLIFNLCIQYPSSPIVWLIASRPEPHITSLFSRHDVIPAYEKEDIPVDSDEARADVEQYLRHELTEIGNATESVGRGWPDERDLWKLADAAGGLFAYAHTVIRYIDDLAVGSPASQLSDVLNVIDCHASTGGVTVREEHPLALLDALYARILSNVPSKFMTNTRKLLLVLASHKDGYPWPGSSLVLLCNWLGMRPDEVYAALNHLRSVLRVPSRDKAHEEGLGPFHKSFLDYISDFTRSGFSPDIAQEAQQLETQCAFRILNEATDGIDFGGMSNNLYCGALACGPGTGANIFLTWPIGGGGGRGDKLTRLNMYRLAMGEFALGIERRDPSFQTEFCIHILATRFQLYTPRFPHSQLCDSVFVAPRRGGFAMRGVLKQIPLTLIDTSKMIYPIKLQFSHPNAATTGLSDPWNLSCTHSREGEWGKETFITGSPLSGRPAALAAWIDFNTSSDG